MRHIFGLFFLGACFLFCASVNAQSIDLQPLRELLRQNAEEREAYLAKGLSGRGRYTEQQSQMIAWLALGFARPQELLAYDAYRDDQHYYHVWDIKVRDGAIYRVTVNSITGQAQWIDALSLGEHVPRLPEGAVTKEDAMAIARAEMKQQDRGIARVRFVGRDLVVHDKRVAYHFTFKKSLRLYDIYVDVWNGKVLSFEKG